jgi:ATP-dependent exoDNAse (exonuclease V) alpha subunit
VALNRHRSSLNGTGKTLGELNELATSTPQKAPELVETIEITAEYEEIARLINQGNKLIFVTGGAGTGKSTFVKWIDRQYSGRVVIAAPTGIAALTVSGVTIHSLCKLPPAWIVDTDINVDPKSVVPKIEILILDEISMVNANLLDAIEQFCRKNRKNQEPFGGLTVIMVGDLFQLPPVVTHTTKPLFRREYGSAKFFAAHSVANSTPLGVELSTPFRQKDEKLIRLLANIREGIDLEASIAEINESCKVTSTPPIGAVHLATRNKDVELINSRELAKLPLPEITFEAKLTGKFSERQLPAPDKITLRKGAQVVFLNNSKKWVNGNIGVVTKVATDVVTVKLVDGGVEVDVRVHEWKNYDYTYDDQEEMVVRKVIGTFVQLPISHAWAMTIHKSQGLTLDQVHLDLGGGAFETGQTYVALSRSRSMEAITLARKISISDVLVDREAIEFYRAIRSQ